MQAERTFQQGMQYYVPAMQAFGDLGQAYDGKVVLGAPIATDADLILNDQSINAAVDTTTFATGFSNTEAQMGKFGRNLVVVASGAATSTVDVYGRDYLGQKMRETLTLNGTTSVVGVKAFRYVDRVVAGVTSSTTIDLGVGTKFGLPYATQKVTSEFADEVSASAGTLTAAVLTDPQTATTGDPRGLYVPTTTPNGTKVLEIKAEFTDYVNASGNGGAHGIRHYNA